MDYCKKLFSIVMPIYKAVLNIPYTVPYIMERIPQLFPDYNVELIMVNDGSPDDSWQMMKEYQQRYPETIRIANLTRNFGQGNATLCGLHMAKGDVIGVISQDLQDPFELFADMLEAVENGHDLVCAVREKREEKGLGVLCSKLTHWLMHNFVSNRYPSGGCDFYLMTQAVVERFFLIYRKGSRIFALLDASASPLFIPYTRRKRELGKSGYTFSKKMYLFISLFLSNTFLPLRIMSTAGFFFAGAAFLFAIVLFISALTIGSPIPVRGWASLALLITFFSGLILASLGIVGEYLWRVYEEVKKKPPFLVAEVVESAADIERKSEHSAIGSDAGTP